MGCLRKMVTFKRLKKIYYLYKLSNSVGSDWCSDERVVVSYVVLLNCVVLIKKKLKL